MVQRMICLWASNLLLTNVISCMQHVQLSNVMKFLVCKYFLSRHTRYYEGMHAVHMMYVCVMCVCACVRMHAYLQFNAPLLYEMD